MNSESSKATYHVLPALLQQTNKSVDGKSQVLAELLAGKSDVADGNTQAENLV